MKADRTWIYKGVIYLPGAEMPEGWTPPKQPDKPMGVIMVGPLGPLSEMPGVPLPKNVTGPGQPIPPAPTDPVAQVPVAANPEAVAGVNTSPDFSSLPLQDLQKIAEEKGISTKGKKKEDLVKELLAPKVQE